MTRVVLSVCGILLALSASVASQQSAEDKRERHRPLTRAERLARVANQTASEEASPTLTANPPSPGPASPGPASPAASAAPAPNRNINPNPTPAVSPATAQSNTPEPPPTDQPPTPPQVTYRNGLLSIQAVNSTLGSVLTAIRNKAGIQFEGLEGGASERVAVVMGPAPAGEVLAAILSGSQFDFVAMERPDSPGIVQRVVLNRKGGSAPTSVAGGNVPTRTSSQGDDEGDPPEEQASGDPDVPQESPARPVMQVQQQPPQPDPQQPQPRTQEQLFQELQRINQQRLQQQQQQQQQQPDSNHRTPP